MSDHDAVIQARTAVARACGALDVIAEGSGPLRNAGLRQIVTELETTGAWLRTLHTPEPDTDTITVAPNNMPHETPTDHWRATRRLPDGKHRVAWGPTPEAAVAQLCGRVVASVDPTMMGVK